ncbi:MAG: hypothetical protein AAGI01_11715, partial [Myxococcota bacterium]
DFLRSGQYTRAIWRRYQRVETAEPLEVSCERSKLGDAPEDDAFTLVIPELVPLRDRDLEVQGRFEGSDTLVLELREGADVEVKRFELATAQARRTCDLLRPFFIRPRFELPGANPNMFPDSADAILQTPRFGMLWLGVRAVAQGATIVWAATNELSEPILVPANNLDPSGRGLRGDLNLSIPAPTERVLVESGDTRFTLGHFVVIDDRDAKPDAFSWDVSEDPIVATALQFATEPDSPFPEATGLGRALLYVEGDLSELHPRMRDKVLFADTYIERNASGAHFYIVDVFFRDRNVVGLRLPERADLLTSPVYREVTMQITERYLNASSILLPRMLPLDSF